MKENRRKYTDHFLLAVYIIFVVSIVFCLRAVSSISIGLILLGGMVKSKNPFTQLSRNNYFLWFLAGCSVLFLLQCISLLFTVNRPEGLTLLQRSSGLVFIPLAVYCTRNFLSTDNFRKIARYFILAVCVASLSCLISASVNFFAGAGSSVFFYHNLVKPISQHAVQFSILVFTALVLLVNSHMENRNFFRGFIFRGITGFLSLFLVLLSSKLIISFYVLYLACFFFQNRIYSARVLAFAFILIVGTVIISTNPVGDRFRSIVTGNFLLFTKQKFDPGIYFNGAQFRLLEWRFTYEILDEQHAWAAGLTPGDAQLSLDKKYIASNMYTGVPGTENQGFIGYHTHNQYLQSLLENGIPGLLAFLFICYALLKMATGKKIKELQWLVAALLVYCFTDAPLKTQYGIVIFTFLPALLYWIQPSMRSAPVQSVFKTST